MYNIREKLVEILVEPCCGLYPASELADYLIEQGVTVQETAHWKDVLDYGSGNCFGICSNCRTQQKAASYASFMTEYRHCRWCGAKMVYQPPKGE